MHKAGLKPRVRLKDNWGLLVKLSISWIQSIRMRLTEIKEIIKPYKVVEFKDCLFERIC
jgi:hypothetical protein